MTRIVNKLVPGEGMLIRDKKAGRTFRGAVYLACGAAASDYDEVPEGSSENRASEPLAGINAEKVSGKPDIHLG